MTKHPLSCSWRKARVRASRRPIDAVTLILVPPVSRGRPRRLPGTIRICSPRCDLPRGMTSPKGMLPNSDRDLVAAAAKGQVAAFATLVGRYRDVHTRYAIRMLGGYDAADEALLT